MKTGLDKLVVESFVTSPGGAALAPPTLQAVCNPASDAGGLTCGMTDCTCRLDHC